MHPLLAAPAVMAAALDLGRPRSRGMKIATRSAFSPGIDGMSDKPTSHESKQLLHLVLGGELKSIDSMEFKDVEHIDVVGVFPNYESAEKAWRAKSQQTVDSRADALFHRPSAPHDGARGTDAEGWLNSSWRRRRKAASPRRRWAIAFAQYLRLVQTPQPVRRRAGAAGAEPRRRASRHRRHVARAAPHAALRAGQQHGRGQRHGVAPSRRRAAGDRAAPARHRARCAAPARAATRWPRRAAPRR